jgi:hypothetical protein
MRLEEWHQVLATEPATPDQLGAVMGEFERLGFGYADRAERLAVSAAILGLDELGSVKDLVMGQAGRLLRVLHGCQDRASLPVPPPAAARPSGAPGRGAVLALAAAALVNAWQRPAAVCLPGVKGPYVDRG